jgi:2-alkenal reductase
MRSISWKFLFTLLVLSIASFACGIITSPLPASPTQEQLSYPTLTAPEPTASMIAEDGFGYVGQEAILTQLYEQANPGVVAIRVLSEEGGGLGSGFVIDDAGHIVTNYHVVLSADDLEIAFSNGYKTRGEIIGTDSDSDIAVIRADAPASELHPLRLGDSNQIKVGQFVVAIGNPHGLDGTMTTGIISSLGRTLNSLHQAPGGNYFTAGDIIQTDAAINPGNSGGPLLNLDGEVIGVNRAIQSNNFDMEGQPINTGIGFAISINIVKRVVPELIATGSFDYPYLGVSSPPEITLFTQEILGLPQPSGVYLLSVAPGSPAEEAGLRAGDIPTELPGYFAGGDLIIGIDGVEVLDFSDLITYLLNNTSPGDIVTLTVLREDSEIQLDLTIGKRP